MRVLTLRNKVEDLKVVPIYLNTKQMLVDLGTKALDPKPFCALRNVLCGYAEEEVGSSSVEEVSNAEDKDQGY